MARYAPPWVLETVPTPDAIEFAELTDELESRRAAAGREADVLVRGASTLMYKNNKVQDIK